MADTFINLREIPCKKVLMTLYHGRMSFSMLHDFHMQIWRSDIRKMS